MTGRNLTALGIVTQSVLPDDVIIRVRISFKPINVLVIELLEFEIYLEFGACYLEFSQLPEEAIWIPYTKPGPGLKTTPAMCPTI
jgi:hypothetical protein